MSHSSTLNMVDQFGVDFDKEVLDWKQELEKSCSVQNMVQEVEKVVKAAEKEVIPYGLETVNVEGLNLTFHQPEIGNPIKGDFGIDVSTIRESF